MRSLIEKLTVFFSLSFSVSLFLRSICHYFIRRKEARFDDDGEQGKL